MYRAIQVTARTAKAPEALACFVFESAAKPPLSSRTHSKAAVDAVAAAMDRPEFSAERGRVTLVYPQGPRTPQRIALVGLGKQSGLNGEAVRLGAAELLRQLGRARVTHVALDLGSLPGGEACDPLLIDALGDGLTLASFSFDAFKGAGTTDPGKKQTLSVAAPGKVAGRLKDAITIAEAANAARRLAATPPNVADPAYITAQCRAMARKAGLKCTVIDAKKAKALGMGGLLAVGAGGSKPPCMIVLEHKPSGVSSGGPILLVGKAISFDTGGYSLKVGGTMKGMKYDKCGGMAVIGAMQAVAALNLKRHVVGLIACAENMIDREAYRVDDIITLANGVTVEVTNTDAEGRLVLADALAYGTKTYKPAAVVDLATLTGGVVVALGVKVAGGFCVDDALWKKVEAAAEHTGEKVWRLPLSEDYRQMMKSEHADLHNSAPVRHAHPIQGAAFLSYFVGQTAPQEMPSLPWCHLDIAGTATTESPDALHDKGPTGYGVRLITRLLQAW